MMQTKFLQLSMGDVWTEMLGTWSQMNLSVNPTDILIVQFSLNFLALKQGKCLAGLYSDETGQFHCCVV